MTSQTAPGSTTPAPSVAAISSPQPSTTRVDASRPAASRSHGATGPSTASAGRTGASEAGSIPNAAHASSDQSPVSTSSSIDDEALDGSTASSPAARQATNDPGSRNQRAAACWSGRLPASQAILAATCPGSRLQPVSARRRSGSIRSARGGALGPARRSIQISAGPSGSPSASAGHHPVELRPERDRPQRPLADLAPDLGQRLRDRAQPLARVLLGPAGVRVGERVGDVARGDVRAVGGDRLRAGALRADVDADDQLGVAHRRSSAPSPGPRR